MAVLVARAMMEVRDETKGVHPFFEKRISKFWPSVVRNGGCFVKN
jgi:hypothetical protein